MKKKWIIIAASLVVIGTIIFGSVMTMLKWDFKKLITEKYNDTTHNITDDFDSIEIDSSTAKITLVLSGENKVECHENKKQPFAVSVQNGALVIIETDERKWYDYIGIAFDKTDVKVYLSEKKYKNLDIKSSTGDVEIPSDFSFENSNIKLSTGDINYFAKTSENLNIFVSTGAVSIENISAGDITLKTTTGKTNLTDVKCKSLTSDGSTGDIILSNVVAENEFFIERNTGNVKFNKCDANEISVKTDTGDVKGSLLNEKIFVTKTDTGKIKVPESLSGGKCKITTDTGDIKITVE